MLRVPFRRSLLKGISAPFAAHVLTGLQSAIPPHGRMIIIARPLAFLLPDSLLLAMHAYHRTHKLFAAYIAIGFVFMLLILGKGNFQPIISTQAATVTVTNKSELQNAIAVAQPGDVIEITGTIQGGIVIVKSGTQTAPITIRGGIIQGGANNRMVEIRDSYWLVFDGITFDGAGVGSAAVYILNSDNNLFKNNVVKNGGGECFRIKAGSQHNSIVDNTVESCGRIKWAPPSGKNAEGLYIGTAPEQLTNNVAEANNSQATDKSGYFANPDDSNLNYIARNIFRPGYPENTKGNECVDVKEGARFNLIENNTCSGQLDINSGGMESRGEGNIFRANTYNAIICGAGIRLGGDDRQTQGVDNWVLQNNFTDYGSPNAICPLSASSPSDVNTVVGAVKVESPNQGYMCGNTVKDAKPISGSFGSQIDQTAFLGTCNQTSIDTYLAQYQFGVPGGGAPFPTNSPVPVGCTKKNIGDADCNNKIELADFQIWRVEYFGFCSVTNTSLCGTDDDNDGILMDANFNFPGWGDPNSDSLVGMADFEIWRKGYFTIP